MTKAAAAAGQPCSGKFDRLVKESACQEDGRMTGVSGGGRL
jgi:hypothetical protein